MESLNHEIEETNSELKALLELQDRENEEGNLVAVLRSGIEQSKDERFVHLSIFRPYPGLNYSGSITPSPTAKGNGEKREKIHKSK